MLFIGWPHQHDVFIKFFIKSEVNLHKINLFCQQELDFYENNVYFETQIKHEWMNGLILIIGYYV